MRFRIRRFLLWVPFEIRTHQRDIPCLTKTIIADSHFQNRTVCYTPIPKTAVAPHIGLVFIYTTPYEVGNPRLDSLPRLPYTHAYSSAQPFVRFKEQLLHICKMIVPTHPRMYSSSFCFHFSYPHPLLRFVSSFSLAFIFALDLGCTVSWHLPLDT